MTISATTPFLAGLSIDPTARAANQAQRMAQLADDAGYDFVAIADHPYNPNYLDTWTLIATLVAQTQRVKFTPDVANLGLRAPAMLYKAAASLQILSGGRVILGVGGGAFPEAIAGYGGLQLATAAELGDAFEEALQIFRLLARPEPVTFAGRHHQLARAQPGPLATTPIPIWTGTQHGRGLRLTGTYADGWFAPLNVYVPPDQVLARQQTIDNAAERAGRDPSAIRRIYNLIGTITPHGPGREIMGKPLSGPADFWIDRIHHYVDNLGFDAIVFWPAQAPEEQATRFADEVLPALRQAVAA